ncbi:NAD-glutamate dehydrogenase [Methylopila jiangsuensis]|uniref:NAD-glutamate dehydrogenase n=1 Tax=Methylopila jiangsuensis TaxID=586230 RepID=A0A9W6JC58_9HYPH|nr:NAD-glutamate dehydrogenase [Methylopila jiangsuensis]MDR6287234.1 glutamate dehydrogenase [Methylopila jiangsuensis]GLK74806.1 NAD-glutamate dehydrogenase [Methylopila jiangsuensis]
MPRSEAIRIKRIAEAGEAAAGGDGPPTAFVEALFAQAGAADLATLDAAALAALARGAWRHFESRRPGAHDIRLSDPDLGPAGETTVIEIVNDDMPYLVDSVVAELAERGIAPRLVLHPILAAERDAEGRLTRFLGDANRVELEDTPRESLIHLHVDRVDGDEARAELAAALDRVLADVRVAQGDHEAMRGAVRAAVAALRETPPLNVEDLAEAAQFLDWLLTDDFVLLGVRAYAFEGQGEDERLEPLIDTGLGLLRDPAARVLQRGGELVHFTPEIRAFFHEPKPLIVTKASVRSRVFRRRHLDYVGVKSFDAQGRVTGELRIVGLFAPTALTRPARSTPFIRRKVDLVTRRAGFDPDSHSGKSLAAALEAHPRDELFQTDADTLYDTALRILNLMERPRVQAIVRRDRFDRFVSVLVYVPRERYDTAVRVRIGAHLAERFGGHVTAYSPGFPEGPLARVQFIIGLEGRDVPEPDAETLDAELAALVATWADRLKAELARARPGGEARRLAQVYGHAFGRGYEARAGAAEAVTDIGHMERLSAEAPFAVDFYVRDDEAGLRLKVFARGAPVPLSRRVPLLENMGFRVIDERSYRSEPAGRGEDGRVWIHDMALERAQGGAIALTPELDDRLEALLLAALNMTVDSDGYDALALEAGLDLREIALIRALSRYLRQARAPYDQDYMWATLTRHAAIAGQLSALFRVRFDPAFEGDRAAREAEIAAGIEEALGAVESLDEDRIVRKFLNLIQACQRTSAYRAGDEGATLAFKFESRKVEDLPEPRPLYEIFVSAPRVEGVHLRFGKVARGGLRWSDRPQDFRTEVLGLVKAQQVKNAVIVPVGAKGGFVPKRLPAGPRDAWLAEGTAAYTLFINALLDVTDDLEKDDIVPPRDVVRHDGDDPYLVVAADKGTATFSDTANGIAEARGFWLGDAFASGGSAGYDHKGMGITARGAWEAVKRHFREMDVDIQATPFTVVGVGDMSGDVFGNGMLLSEKIRLIAAFDHRDIFLDPDPDPAVSFEERRRLFALPRSSWADYDRARISKGGGVFSRALKTIPLSEEVRAALGFDRPSATPQQVISAILKAPADLLWFGGIGTYVRAGSETDEQAGDRVNDAVRVAASELRVKVVGEGANLGVTQKGRIEAARKGVRINTDAIDNSAGVNTSDVEVNVKIAFAGLLRDGALARDQRDRILVEMTDEVAALVLANNYDQTLALSLAQRSGVEEAGFQTRLMQALEARGLLNRAVEVLPDDAALAERGRAGDPLTRPEIAVLLAWAKIALYDDLLASGAPDDPAFEAILLGYFPTLMRERFRDAILNHRLRREIVATALANVMINHGGPALAVRLADQTGAPPARIAAAYAVVARAYDLDGLKAEIDALDNRVPGALQLELYDGLSDLLLRRMIWFLSNVDVESDVAATAERFRDGVEAVAADLDAALGPDAAGRRSARATELARAGVPHALAVRLSGLLALEGAPDAVLVAEKAGRPIGEAAATLFAVADLFQLGRVILAAQAITATDYYERLALDRARDQIGFAARAMAVAALNAAPGASGPEAVAVWAEASPDAGRVRKAVAEIAGSGVTLARLSVAASLLADLARETA